MPALRATQADLEARQVPADRVIVIGYLARLANHFRNDRPADAWQMLFEDYVADLDGISQAHIAEILNGHRREKPWFPKSADLIERWHAILRAENERLRRTRVLQGLEAAKPWEIA